MFFRKIFVAGMVGAVCTLPKRAWAHGHNYFNPNLKKAFYERVALDNELAKKEKQEFVFRTIPWVREMNAKQELIEDMYMLLTTFTKPVSQKNRVVLRSIVNDIIEKYKMKGGNIDAEINTLLLVLRYYKAI